MNHPAFFIESVNLGCFLIHDHDRTVALVTPQGYIDWLLRSPLEQGPRLRGLLKETHLCYTIGLKLMLTPPTPGSDLRDIRVHPFVENEGRTVRLLGTSISADKKIRTVTVAILRTDDDTTRYHWDLSTKMTNVTSEPATYPWVEFNNVYPSRAGRCFMFAPQKQFNQTLMTDRDGVVWKFPHQHLMHYTQKINQLRFKPGTMAGFFGEPTGSPVVIVKKSTIEPDWAICDMFYDLHCGARSTEPILPGQSLEFEYQVKYLPRAESEALVARSIPVPVTDEDRKRHDYPRLELGMNSFIREVDIGGADDASGFRQNPPQKVWDRQVGTTGKGSLRITNENPEETAWTAEPPTQIPANKSLNIRARVKTQGVEGRGMFIRIKYHTFDWNPTPHVDWAATLTSVPVSGTTPDWVEVSVPELAVPNEHFDYLIAFEVVLDGKGVAWITDIDIDLNDIKPPDPGLEVGSSAKAKKADSIKATSGAGATA